VPAARNICLLVGLGTIIYSAITNYRYSVAKVIPLGVHMVLDVAGGFILILAPWVLGYRDELTGGQMGLHYILGLGVIGLVALTRPRSERERLELGRGEEPPQIRRAA